MKVDQELKYNYIYFNSEDNKLRRDYTGYYTICAKDLESLQDVKVVTYPLDYMPKIVRYLYAIHHSQKINKIVNLPLKKMWYKLYFKDNFNNSKLHCFIVSGNYVTVDYLQYLKRKYPNAKFVKLFRDKREIFFRVNPAYTEEVLNDSFDLIMTFDEIEAKKYGMIPFVEFESKINIEPTYEHKCDVFFAGKAKDRLDVLLEVYDKLAQRGINCSYYLTGVPTNLRVPRDGIEYAEKNMSYYQMLQRTLSCKCLLEINQKDVVGFTSRFLEAVMYSKKIITNNSYVKKSPYYSPKYVQYFESVEDINPEFVLKKDDVDYNYDGGFSPVELLKRIDKLL